MSKAMEPIKVRYDKRIKELAKPQRPSSREIAADIGIDRSTLLRFEDGENVTAATLDKILAWLESRDA